MHHGGTFNFGTAKVNSPALFETYFSYKKDTCIWIAATYYYMYFYHNCAISIDSYSTISKFNSSIILSLLINAVILLLDCLVLIHVLYLYIYFLLDIIFST